MNIPPLRRLYNRAVTRFSHTPRGPAKIETCISWLHQRGIRSLPFPAVFRSDAVYLEPKYQDYDAPTLIHRSAQTVSNSPGVERWVIASPAMRREVHVQVLRLGDPAVPAPLLLLLDGSSAPSSNGWLLHGNIAETLAMENVIIVLPTEASGSHYANWKSIDPTLGYMQWETFLSTELLSVLEDPAHGLSCSGQRIIGGLSMGAGSAVRIANSNPGVFAGVIGISGCYSTTDPLGWEYHHAITRSVGGHTRNLWDAQRRAQADVCLNPTGLRDSAVYLFTADGVITPRDLDFHVERPFQELIGSVLLEFASWNCTQRLDAALRAAGIQHINVVYQHGGVHDWIYCSEQLRAAWDWLHLQPQFQSPTEHR